MRFSIVVPVYNVADYLGTCMSSILAQKLEDDEIILVDDGSTDGKSGALCDDYAAAHPGLVRVIHQQNGGLGAARNTGIEAARGEWLLFVDSDDRIAPNTLETLARQLHHTEAKMIVFDFCYETEQGILPSEPRQSAVTGAPQSLATDPELLLDSPSACFRLWHRSLFADGTIRFPARVWYEDLCTTPKALLRAGQIVQIPDVLYFYYQRQGSIMRNANLRRNLEILDALETVRAYYETQGALETHRAWLCVLSVDNAIQAARRVLMADPKADYLPDFVAYLQTHYPDYRSVAELRRLGRKKLLLLKLLEGRHYKAARAIFRATALLRSIKPVRNETK